MRIELIKTSYHNTLKNETNSSLKLLQITNLIFNTINSEDKSSIDFDIKIKYAIELFDNKKIYDLTLKEYIFQLENNFEGIIFNSNTSLKVEWIKNNLFEINQTGSLQSITNELLLLGLLKFSLINILISKNNHSNLSLSILNDLKKIKYSSNSEKKLNALNNFFFNYLNLILDSFYEQNFSLKGFDLDKNFYLLSRYSKEVNLSFIPETIDPLDRTKKLLKEFLKAYSYLPEKIIENKTIKIFDNSFLNSKILLKICEFLKENSKIEIPFCIQASILYNHFPSISEHVDFKKLFKNLNPLKFNYLDMLELFEFSPSLSKKNFFCFLSQYFPFEIIENYYLNLQKGNLTISAIDSFTENELEDLISNCFKKPNNSANNLLRFIIDKNFFSKITEYINYIKNFDMNFFDDLINHQNCKQIFNGICSYLQILFEKDLFEIDLSKINAWLLKKNDYFYFKNFAEEFLEKKFLFNLRDISSTFLILFLQEEITKNSFLIFFERLNHIKTADCINLNYLFWKKNNADLFEKRDLILHEIFLNILPIEFPKYEGFKKVVQERKAFYSNLQIIEKLDDHYKELLDRIDQKEKLTFCHQRQIVNILQKNLCNSIYSLIHNQQIIDSNLSTQFLKIVESIKINEDRFKSTNESISDPLCDFELMNEFYELTSFLIILIKNFEILDLKENQKLILFLFFCATLISEADIDDLLKSKYFHIAIEKFFRQVDKNDASILNIFNLNEIININFFKKILIHSTVLQNDLFILFFKKTDANDIKDYIDFLGENNFDTFNQLLSNQNYYPLVLNQNFPKDLNWRYNFIKKIHFPKETSTFLFSIILNFICFDKKNDNFLLCKDFFIKLSPFNLLSFLNQNDALLKDFQPSELLYLIENAKIRNGYNNTLDLFIQNVNNLHPNLYSIAVPEFIELGTYPSTNFLHFLDKLKLLSQQKNLKIPYKKMKNFFTNLLQINEEDLFYFKNINLFCHLGDFTDLEYINFFYSTLKILGIDRLPGLCNTDLVCKIKRKNDSFLASLITEILKRDSNNSLILLMKNKVYIEEIIGAEETELIKDKLQYKHPIKKKREIIQKCPPIKRVKQLNILPEDIKKRYFYDFKQ